MFLYIQQQAITRPAAATRANLACPPRVAALPPRAARADTPPAPRARGRAISHTQPLEAWPHNTRPYTHTRARTYHNPPHHHYIHTLYIIVTRQPRVHQSAPWDMPFAHATCQLSNVSQLCVD